MFARPHLTPWLLRTASVVAGLVAALGAVQAQAADTVLLSNGFTVTCLAHTQVSPDTLRLYLSSDRNNYMDVATGAILSIEAGPQGAPDAHTEVAAAAPRLHDLLQHSGAVHNVNAALLASVVRAESAGKAGAVSHKGAQGLMQLMPTTAAQLGVHDSLTPADNVDGGSAYLDQLLTRYHDNIALALAAYNAGPGAVDRYHGVPPYRETRLYVARVVREFNRLVLADAARSSATAAAMLPGASH